jgi:hypothetical protein
VIFQKNIHPDSKRKMHSFCDIRSLLREMVLSILEIKRNRPTLLLDTFRYTPDKFQTQLFTGHVQIVHVLDMLYNTVQIHQV